MNALKLTLLTLFSGYSFLSLANNTYTVPMDSEFATNPIENFQLLTDKDGTVSLSYQLPEDLVGDEAKPIQMMLEITSHSAQGLILKFKDSEGDSWALCQTNDMNMSCTTEYEDNIYDQKKRDLFLNNKFQNDKSLLAEKLRVAREFSGDPIGILNVLCESRYCGL